MAHSSIVISYIMSGDILNDSNFLRTEKKIKGLNKCSYIILSQLIHSYRIKDKKGSSSKMKKYKLQVS